MQRSPQQNKLYHTLCSDLQKFPVITIWDGRFELAGYTNPIRFRPRAFSYDSLRDLLKQCDLEYEKDVKGVALSSAKISVETMNSHIAFLEALLIEE